MSVDLNTSSFEVTESPKFGRFITASRDFVMNEIIFEEAPLLVSPYYYQKSNQKVNGEVSGICVGCCQFLTNPTLSCAHCGWPICSSFCSEETFHARYECPLFTRHGIRPTEKALSYMSVIRGALMYLENPSGWKDFTSLSSNIEIKRDDMKERLGATMKFINDVCQLKVDLSTVEKILQTFAVNAFTMKDIDENGSLYEGKLLYKLGCLFEHSCAPNGEWIILPSKQNGIQKWNIRIYARRNIRRNEAITIAYIEDTLYSDTPTRQKNISASCYFYCQCQRCVDGTEFSYYTSAVKCTVCGNRSLIADVPSDEFSTWTCAVCRICKDSLVVKSYVKEFEIRLKAIMKIDEYENRGLRLDKLVNSWDKRNLTENHRAVTRAIYYWLECQLFEDLLNFSMEGQLKFIKIMKRSTQCLKMFRMFVPLDYVAYVELVFAYAIASFYFKTQSLRSIEYDQYSLKEKRQIISAIFAHLKIAVEIIEWTPFNTVYSHFRSSAISNLKFWSQLEALTCVPASEEEDVDFMLSSSANHENGQMNLLNRMKMSLGKFWTRIRRWSGAQINPDVSLLTELDFYFNN